MKVKLDENLGLRGSEILTAAGVDVATVAQQGLCGAPDQRLLELCRDEGRCLVTLDMDFSNPVQYPPRDYAGIVVLRPGGRVLEADLRATMSLFARTARDRDVTGRLWIVQPDRIREYADHDDD